MSDAQGKNTNEELRAGSFFIFLKTEFKKIIWPDRYTVGKQLAAVLCVTVLTGILIALVDYASRYLINFLVGLGA